MIRMCMTAIVSLFAVGIVLPMQAAEPKFKAARTKKAQSDFLASKRTAELEYRKHIRKSQEEYLQQLKKAYKDAVVKENFQEVVKIHDTIRHVQDRLMPVRKTRARFGASAFRNHFYMLFPGNVSWDVAKSRCEAMGGTLVCIETKEEAVFLGKWTAGIQPWVGARKLGNKWRWINGKAVAREIWESKRPFPTNTSRAILFKSGLGDSAPTLANSHGFLCEWVK